MLMQDGLFHFPTALFAISLAGQSLLDSLFLTWFQVKGMPFDFFDNVFGLDLSLETAQGVLYRFALLQFYVCQLKIHLQIHRKFTAAFTKVVDIWMRQLIQAKRTTCLG